MKIGNKCKIISDNDGYTKFLNKVLVVTFVSKNKNDHPGYDEALSPQKLYDLKVHKTNEIVPFSLYDYELQTL
jgi:hypothetical protein